MRVVCHRLSRRNRIVDVVSESTSYWAHLSTTVIPRPSKTVRSQRDRRGHRRSLLATDVQLHAPLAPCQPSARRCDRDGVGGPGRTDFRSALMARLTRRLGCFPATAKRRQASVTSRHLQLTGRACGSHDWSSLGAVRFRPVKYLDAR